MSNKKSWIFFFITLSGIVSATNSIAQSSAQAGAIEQKLVPLANAPKMMDFEEFFDRMIEVIKNNQGYLTHVELERILNINLITKNDSDDNYVSTYESQDRGLLSLRLVEYKNDPNRPDWMDAQAAIKGAHSILDIAMGVHCLNLEEAKSKLLEAGLNFQGEVQHIGYIKDEFSDINGFTRVKIYSSRPLEHIPSCVQSVHLEGNYKGKVR